jgi:hypothetical protein
MMKSIRIFGAALAFLCLAAFPAPAQFGVIDLAAVTQTLDIANLMQAVDTLYATYDEITAVVENVKNTYQQLENQIKALQNINFDDVGKLQDIKDIRSLEDFSNFRYTIKDAVANINSNMNYLNDIEDTLKNEPVNFFGSDITIASLTGHGREGEKTLLDLPKLASDYMKEQGEAAASGWEKKLSAGQKTYIMRKWGLSARNYANWQMAAKMTADIVSSSIGYGKNTVIKIVEKMSKKNEAIRNQMDMALGEGSTNAVMATLNEGILSIAEGVAQLDIESKRANAIAATRAVEEQLKEEIKADEAENEKRKSEALSNTFPRRLNPLYGGSLDN